MSKKTTNFGDLNPVRAVHNYGARFPNTNVLVVQRVDRVREVFLGLYSTPQSEVSVREAFLAAQEPRERCQEFGKNGAAAGSSDQR